ncbi:hypothetical protein ARTHRO9AX_20027 [Arthrobacter sp. 9AX]|nr:hypothetical protein ARTHRO9AX_20027 [Arthrobacter sp. 9AX]
MLIHARGCRVLMPGRPSMPSSHLLDFGGAGSAHAPSFPAAAAHTNVGSQGAHGTCASPSPAFSEKIRSIADDEWDGLIEDAKQLLHVHSAAFADSKVGEAIRSLLDEEFGAELPAGPWSNGHVPGCMNSSRLHPTR